METVGDSLLLAFPTVQGHGAAGRVALRARCQRSGPAATVTSFSGSSSSPSKAPTEPTGHLTGNPNATCVTHVLSPRDFRRSQVPEVRTWTPGGGYSANSCAALGLPLAETAPVRFRALGAGTDLSKSARRGVSPDGGEEAAEAALACVLEKRVGKGCALRFCWHNRDSGGG